MLISVHTPKCGGSSFRALLQDHFQEYYIGDYSDKPISKPFVQRTEEAQKFRKHLNPEDYSIERSCIHGHFLPFKYIDLIHLPDVKFITWLRDPLERAASHYYYWKRTENNKAEFKGFRKRVKVEKWSLEKFCFSEELRNIYSIFFWKFPIENFDFIGITEFFEADIKSFALKHLNKNLANIPEENVNEAREKAYFKDPYLIRELKDFHSKDYELYHQALLERNKREGKTTAK